MSDLHEADIFAWSQRQAELLRRVARGERVNDADLDWPNIVEELEDVGGNVLRGVRNSLKQAMLHELKALAWPDSVHVPHWQAEAREQRDNARADYTPSMRDKIDVAELYRRALRALPTASDGVAPLPVPLACPYALDELLAEDDPEGRRMG